MNGIPLKMKKVKESPIIEMICNWNAERYQQMYDHELTVNLLNEEVLETQEAMNRDDAVEIMDGLGDVFFVTIGAMWKKGFTPSNIIAHLDNIPHIMHDMPVPVVMHWLLFVDDVSILSTMAIASFNTIASNTSTEAAVAIIEAICKSNNTKTATMTLPNVKANIDKGPNFVPPTRDITDILSNLGVQSGN